MGKVEGDGGAGGDEVVMGRVEGGGGSGGEVVMGCKSDDGCEVKVMMIVMVRGVMAVVMVWVVVMGVGEWG